MSTVVSLTLSLRSCAKTTSHLFLCTRTATTKQPTCQTHPPGAKISWTGSALSKLIASKVQWPLIVNRWRVSFAGTQGGEIRGGGEGCFSISTVKTRADKMNRILRCDWVPAQARWSSLGRSGLLALSRKKIVIFFHTPNLLLNKQFAAVNRLRLLDIGLVLFLRVFGPRLRTRSKKST